MTAGLFPRDSSIISEPDGPDPAVRCREETREKRDCDLNPQAEGVEATL
jgi:hypothetical protein